MKKTKKITATILVCLLLVCSVLPVCAAQPVITDPPCSLTISYSVEGNAVAGASFDLYRVAQLSEDGTLNATQAFAPYKLDWNDLSESQLQDAAVTLLGYAQLDRIQPDATVTVGEDGFARNDQLPTGLYLIAGGRLTTEEGTYSANPMLVSLPMKQAEGSWNYVLTVVPKASFLPSREVVERRILKVWDDKGLEDQRPDSIEVTLLQDGKALETVELNAENNWRYAWTELDAAYQWTVVETPVDGYTATHETKGVTTVITNTPDIPETEPTDPTDPTEPEEPELPKTGMLWWPVPVMAALGLLLVAAGIRMRRGARYEA